MARYRAPSRRTVVAVAAIGALVAVALVLAPDAGGLAPDAALVLLSADGTAAPSARLDSATLARLRVPAPPPSAAEPAAVGPASDSAAGGAPGAPVDRAPPSAGADAAPAEPADTAPPPPTLRVPLVLALRVEGSRAASPRGLRLSVPAPFRLAAAASTPPLPAVEADSGPGGDGSAEDGAVGGWGDPLTAYAIPLREVEVAAGDPPTRITADTVWLEYRARDLDCELDGDSVPRFLSASAPPAGALEDVRLFYAIEFRRGGRQTGVLRLELEPPASALSGAREIALEGAGPTQLRVGGFALADTALQLRAAYRARCANGARSDPLTVRFLASELGGARAYLVGSRGRPRLRLEDLDGDDVIEREAWDPDGDGRFEAARTLRLPLPRTLDAPERRAFLNRLREARAERAQAEAAARAAARAARADSAAAARPSPDSVRPRPAPSDSAPPRPPPSDSVRARPPPSDSVRPRPPPSDTTPRPPPRDSVRREPPPRGGASGGAVLS